MRFAFLVCVLVVACGPVGARDVDGPRVASPRAPIDARALLAAPSATRFVVVERGAQGSRLVMVDEEGLRQRVLTESDAAAPILDLMPAWSPDGRWIVFASTRARGALNRYSLWIISAIEPGAQPVRLTSEAEIDWTPAWTPAGDAIVFASTGDSGSFDLWRLELTAAPAGGEGGADGEGTATPPHAGRLTRLTTTASEDMDPSVSPDGKRIAFSAVTDGRSRVTITGADGTSAIDLGDGKEPTWSPDGAWLAFVAPAEVREDRDIWRMRADGKQRTVLVDDDVADEESPRFSVDGRFLIATSVLRNSSLAAVTSTLVVAALAEQPPRWQALIDQHPAARKGAALAPVALRADVLARAPPYKDALKKQLLAPTTP